MTDKQWVDPHAILTEGIQQGLKAYERTNSVPASAQAVSEVISERFGFPSVFAILAGKLTLQWWLLELSPGVTVEGVLNNVLTGIVAQQLADELGLDIGATMEGKVQQNAKQGRSVASKYPSPTPPKLSIKKLPKPKPIQK